MKRASRRGNEIFEHRETIMPRVKEPQGKRNGGPVGCWGSKRDGQRSVARGQVRPEKASVDTETTAS